MNCKAGVSQQDGRFFAEVFVCPGCYRVAETLHNRAQQELKLVLVMMRDAIRLSLLQGQLQFKTPEQLSEAPSGEIVKQMASLVEHALENQKWNQHGDRSGGDKGSTTLSSESMRLGAKPAGGS